MFPRNTSVFDIIFDIRKYLVYNAHARTVKQQRDQSSKMINYLSLIGSPSLLRKYKPLISHIYNRYVYCILWSRTHVLYFVYT